ncbi:MAG: cytochrome c oxidase subunit 3 [Gammaproteobacteria bacterium]|nr:cytochrome c oxidase subunit 3 [Gammaproteobacteria bacterium]
MGHTHDKYYVPHGSHWPIVGSVALFLMLGGFASYLNGAEIAGTVSLIGLAILVVMMAGWFGNVITESMSGYYNAQVDKSFRMGMMWFIFSEVMFFAAFFGALFYARQLAIPWLGGEGTKFMTNLLLWPGFEAMWPSNGPAHAGGEFETMAATGLPALNTAILLTSSVTITIAHHALRKGNRLVLNLGVLATVILGFTFISLQASEYMHAYSELNLKLSTGIYGSTFFVLTGFHGLHVTVGAIFLTVIWFRVLRGHFTPKKHFAFEAASWYWHFVDVVWLCLYFFVYWL